MSDRLVDRALYALFSQHADAPRHERDRRHYRGTTIVTGFDVFVARLHALAWAAAVVVLVGTASLGFLVPAAAVDALVELLARLVPGRAGAPVLAAPVPPSLVVAVAALVAGIAAREVVLRGGGWYVRSVARARRSDIERTLPGAVRYLHVLASGNPDKRALIEEVATKEGAYGETAVAFRTVLNRAALSGSVDAALRVVARDTPSRNSLAPFLLKFREHAEQGSDAVVGYLRLESRMLENRQARHRQEAEGFLELLAELFIVLLVLPALGVIALTVLSILAPSLGRPVATPLGPTTVRALLVYGCGGFVLVVGVVAAWLVHELRPAGYGDGYYTRSPTLGGVLRNALHNPADALPVFSLVGVGAGALLWRVGVDPGNVALLGYVAFAAPVGLVALRRAHADDAKDREMKDFVHAVSGHVRLGRPFAAAVERAATESTLGALERDVADLAFNLGLTDYAGDVRTAALDRFVADVGTPLAEQTVGLLTGAFDAGSDTETVFEALQSEVGRLYDERKSLRSQLLVYVAVGWTTALLVVGIVVAVNVAVLESFAQLSAVSTSTSALAIDPNAVDPARDRYRFYLVAQSTMLACGWFAGSASRGRYEALLHSAALVAVAYVVFAGVGML